MNGHRCHSFMCPVDILVGASRSGEDCVCGWRCVACGEIVDPLIVQNRIRVKDQRCVSRERKPRQAVRAIRSFIGRRGIHSSGIGSKVEGGRTSVGLSSEARLGNA
jgi:hypothetical protein